MSYVCIKKGLIFFWEKMIEYTLWEEMVDIIFYDSDYDEIVIRDVPSDDFEEMSGKMDRFHSLGGYDIDMIVDEDILNTLWNGCKRLIQREVTKKVLAVSTIVKY